MEYFNEKFNSLDPQKQERIVNAALSEFSYNGYKKASTNEIVKVANISKGLLFHYFGNKKNLFLSLYSYCLETLTNEMNRTLETSSRDLFERIREVQLMKLQLNKLHPEFFRFLESALIETDGDVKPEIDKINDNAKLGSMDTLLKNIDPPDFKEGLDLQKVVNMILWISEGYGQQLLRTSKLTGKPIDYESALEGAHQYMDILKNLVTK